MRNYFHRKKLNKYKILSLQKFFAIKYPIKRFLILNYFERIKNFYSYLVNFKKKQIVSS
jgi:hypothetical protein